MNLKDIRDQIDSLDSKIIKLLNDRMEMAVISKKLKTGIEDAGREKEIIDRINRNARGLVDPDFFTRFYQDVFAESKRLQALDLKTVGFQGEHGANSEMAAKAWAPGHVAIPCLEFSQVIDRVTKGVVDYGILPVENTLGGIVGPANDLLVYTELFVISAVDLPIRHCLLAAPGTDYREIRTVYSHPQALIQCRNFLSRNKLDPVPYGDTAGAAKMIHEKGFQGTAAIANALCAELYGLEVIKENIQDSPNNRTRFFVLSRERNDKGGGKCTAVFTTENKAGCLFRVLEIFAKSGINLTRIESVPNEPGDFAIFLDLIGSDKDPKVQDAIEQAKKITSGFRILGCYDELVV